jgi:holo-[acyl-carrier protein] synthase
MRCPCHSGCCRLGGDVRGSVPAQGFTSGEIDDCQGHYFHGLAARFAAKEAVIKAFADPDMPFPLREIARDRNNARTRDPDP